MTAAPNDADIFSILEGMSPIPRPARPAYVGVGHVEPPTSQRLDIWREAVVREVLATLRDARQGTVNDALNWSAYRLGRVLPPTTEQRNHLHDLLIDAVPEYIARDGRSQAEATIASGFRGADEAGPACPPEREGYEPMANVIEITGGEPTGEPFPGDETTESSPFYADIAAFLAGDLPEAPTPTVLARQDGHALTYRGQVNVVFGDPENGKTFVALAACVEELRTGGQALFVDLDHNTMPAVVSRLLLLGAPRAALSDTDRFRYCEPDDTADLKQIVNDCVDWRPGVAVVDSLGELLPMVGASSDSADDFTIAHGRVLKPLAMSGAAVLVVDHLAKNPTSRMHGPTGTMAKRRVLGGVSLRVKASRPFTPGQGGSALLIVNKDRHGGVRAQCPTGEREPLAGTFVLDPPDETGVCAWRVIPPIELSGTHASFDDKAREYLAAVREAAPGEVTAKQVAVMVSGDDPPTENQTERARHWLGKLTEAGQVEQSRTGGRGKGPITWQLAFVSSLVSNQTGNQTPLFDHPNQTKSDEIR